MIKVGVTGNIGSGKTSVEDILIKKGYKTICADRISHELFDNDKKIRAQIYDTFETNDRLEIANVIFKNKTEKKKLEEILHPEIKKIIQNEMHKSKRNVVFAFVPLLFEAGFGDIFDKIMLISANENLRMQRIIKRNGYDAQHALERIRSQVSEEEKIKKCDFVLKNEGSLADLEKNLENILNNLLGT